MQGGWVLLAQAGAAASHRSERRALDVPLAPAAPPSTHRRTRRQRAARAARRETERALGCCAPLLSRQRRPGPGAPRRRAPSSGPAQRRRRAPGRRRSARLPCARASARGGPGIGAKRIGPHQARSRRSCAAPARNSTLFTIWREGAFAPPRRAVSSRLAPPARAVRTGADHRCVALEGARGGRRAARRWRAGPRRMSAPRRARPRAGSHRCWAFAVARPQPPPSLDTGRPNISAQFRLWRSPSSSLPLNRSVSLPRGTWARWCASRSSRTTW